MLVATRDAEVARRWNERALWAGLGTIRTKVSPRADWDETTSVAPDAAVYAVAQAAITRIVALRVRGFPHVQRRTLPSEAHGAEILASRCEYRNGRTGRAKADHRARARPHVLRQMRCVEREQVFVLDWVAGFAAARPREGAVRVHLARAPVASAARAGLEARVATGVTIPVAATATIDKRLAQPRLGVVPKGWLIGVAIPRVHRRGTRVTWSPSCRRPGRWRPRDWRRAGGTPAHGVRARGG
jgi:hypothetical protein